MELDAIDRHELFSVALCLRGPDEGKLDVTIEVVRKILERKLEFLHRADFLHRQRNDFLATGLVDELLDTFDSRVVKVAEQEDVQLRRLLDDWLWATVRYVLLGSSFAFGQDHISESDPDEADDARLEPVLGRFDDDDELLVGLRRHGDDESFLQFLG